MIASAIPCFIGIDFKNFLVLPKTPSPFVKPPIALAELPIPLVNAI